MSYTYPPRPPQRQTTSQLEEGTLPSTSRRHSDNESQVHDSEDDDHSESDPPMLKVTGFRLLVVCTMLSFGVPKAVLSYRGQSIMPTTLELIMGTILGICFYLADKLEGQPRWPWLFHVDYLGLVVNSISAMYASTFSKGISGKLKDLARKNIDELTREDILALRDVYKRFRILVLGPANAGKSTLLERLSNSPAGVAIVTRNGKPIQEVPEGSGERGIHRITDEVTYASNPGFVFHYSGSFEAGADEEIRAIWDFIRKCSLASPSEQLHAIWVCIPTGNDQAFGTPNLDIFSKPTGSVPVIGVFTKLDERETIERVKLLGHNPSPFNIARFRSQVEQKTADFVDDLEREFRKLPHPPADFIRLRSMHNDSVRSRASRNRLFQTTMDAFPPGTLKLLLKVMVRNKNCRTHTIYVLQLLLGGEVKGNIVDRTPAVGKDEASELSGDQAFRTLLTLPDLSYDLDSLPDDRLLPLPRSGSYGSHLYPLPPLPYGDDDPLPPFLDYPPLGHGLALNFPPEELPEEELPEFEPEFEEPYVNELPPFAWPASGRIRLSMPSATPSIPLPNLPPPEEEPPFFFPPELDYWPKACAPLLKLSRDLPMASNHEVRYLIFICLVVLRIRHGRNADPDGPETARAARSIQARIVNELVDKGTGRVELDSRSMAAVLARIIDDMLM